MCICGHKKEMHIIGAKECYGRGGGVAGRPTQCACSEYVEAKVELKKLHIDRDLLVGAERETDIMQWLRRQIVAEYGERAIIHSLFTDGELDFEGDSYKVIVNVIVPEKDKNGTMER